MTLKNDYVKDNFSRATIEVRSENEGYVGNKDILFDIVVFHTENIVSYGGFFFSLQVLFVVFFAP